MQVVAVFMYVPDPRECPLRLEFLGSLNGRCSGYYRCGEILHDGRRVLLCDLVSYAFQATNC